MRLFFLNPIKTYKTRSRFFGYYTFKKCWCGCTKEDGWGFNFFLFGVNSLPSSKEGKTVLFVVGLLIMAWSLMYSNYVG